MNLFLLRVPDKEDDIINGEKEEKSVKRKSEWTNSQKKRKSEKKNSKQKSETKIKKKRIKKDEKAFSSSRISVFLRILFVASLSMMTADAASGKWL